MRGEVRCEAVSSRDGNPYLRLIAGVSWGTVTFVIATLGKFYL